MNWLQNVIIIIISFFLARIIIDANIHENLVNRLIRKSSSDLTSLVTAILFISYGLSLFFPNTIVVLSMIPVIKFILNNIREGEIKKTFTTNLILALIYGANIGGMGSLTGSPANIMYIAFIEAKNIPGRENVTFFSWLLFGIPATLVLVLISRTILKVGEKRGVELPQSGETEADSFPSASRKYIYFFFINMLIIILLTAAQFILKPAALWGRLNIIDLLLLVYLCLFILFAFVYPKGKKNLGQIIRNLVFLVVFLLFLPLIFLNETLKEIQVRLKRRQKGVEGKLDRVITNGIGTTWSLLFHERGPSVKEQNPRTFISINRLIYDLPFFGLLFMGLVVLVIYFLLKLGDNPATPQMDGHIFRFLNDLTNQTIPAITNLFLFLLVVVLISIFATELVNNTTVVLILFPIITQICLAMDLNPLFILMAVSIASTGAFMTPVATSVNAIAYASIQGVSLKRMLKLGFVLNLLSGLWITLLFHLINKF